MFLAPINPPGSFGNIAVSYIFPKPETDRTLGIRYSAKNPLSLSARVFLEMAKSLLSTFIANNL